MKTLQYIPLDLIFTYLRVSFRAENNSRVGLIREAEQNFRWKICKKNKFESVVVKKQGRENFKICCFKSSEFIVKVKLKLFHEFF